MKLLLIALGVILLAIGLVNHFVLHQNPVAHSSTIVLALGAVLFVVGVALTLVGGNKAG